ncbi:MAG: ROK family protein [Acidimicrobiia bacterium]|nr:ROK family protein [Acidimicrobiia bacterium]
MQGTVLALDVGGTKVAAGLVDSAGRLLARASRPTPPEGTGEEVFAALLAVAAAVRQGDEVAVGVGSGGPMTFGGEMVSPINIPGWREFPLRARLQQSLGVDVHVDNDAKALAVAEAWVGEAQGERNFMAMVVSTGVGGGIVLDGRLLDGAAGNAGHIGHVIVEPDGARCACGGRGCLEAEVSGTAIQARTARPAAEADAAERSRTGQLVGRAVASAAALLDLRLAVVAGSVALGFGTAFFEAAQAELDRSARIGFIRGVRIRPARLGDAGPLVGAGGLAWRALGHSVGIAP